MFLVSFWLQLSFSWIDLFLLVFLYLACLKGQITAKGHTKKCRLQDTALKYRFDQTLKSFCNLQCLKRDANLFWHRKNSYVRKVNSSGHGLSEHEGLLARRKWQMSLGCAHSAGSSSTAAWTHDVNCVTMWTSLLVVQGGGSGAHPLALK